MSCTTGRRQFVLRNAFFATGMYASTSSSTPVCCIGSEGNDCERIASTVRGGLVCRVGFAGSSHSGEEREFSNLQNIREQNYPQNSDLVNIFLLSERCGIAGKSINGHY